MSYKDGDLPLSMTDTSEGEHGARWSFVDTLRGMAADEAIAWVKERDFRARRTHIAREKMFDEIANVLEKFLPPRDTVCPACGFYGDVNHVKDCPRPSSSGDTI